MFFDLPLDQLKVYQPDRVEPADFDAFWQASLIENRMIPLNPRFEAVETGLKLIEVFDVTFTGYAGQPIKGWLLLPRGEKQPLTCVVQYIGYGGGRGLPTEWLLWPSAGYALFVMDTRGQGSGWRKGDTPDLELEGGNPQAPGFMTRGILSPATYYYRRLYVDAVRAVDTARWHPAVNPGRVAVTGHSQGGGLAIAVAGLVPDLLAVMPSEPFLCHIRTATEMVDTFPYDEIQKFCKVHRDQIETVFQTLSYFDAVQFAARAKSPALFSVSLMDDICPPRTVFAAYNHYQGEKEIRVWQYNRHEGGEAFFDREKLEFMAKL